MQIRNATPLDVDTVVRLSGGLFAEDAGTRDPRVDTSWPSRSGRPYFDAAVTDDDARLLVAERGGHAVGYLLGRRHASDPLRPGAVVADVESMFVLPEQRPGGVGAALVAAFRAWASAVGATALSVTAYAANARARRFYARLGFTDHMITLQRGVIDVVDHQTSPPRQSHARSPSNASTADTGRT